MPHTPVQLLGPAGVQLGHETIDLMGGHEIPPSAQNYEVWLSYNLGHPEVRRSIDAHIQAGDRFTTEINAEIYNLFFSKEKLSAHVLATGETIARELNDIIAALEAGGEDAKAYGATLRLAATQIEAGLDAANMRVLISGLSTATQNIAAQNERLSKKLQESSADMEQMRAALKQVRTEAMTDGLTGLANRRQFDEVLKDAMAKATATGGEFSLLLCDIDHFKRFNDTWGHQTGDQIIRFIASTLQRHSRKPWCVARYGGEEFAIIMPRTPLVEARALAEDLRAAIESKKLYRKSTSEDLGKITISLGIARLQQGDTIETLIDRADSCLYASKRNGRNRVTTDQDHDKRTAAA